MKKIIILALFAYESLVFAGEIILPPALLFVGDGSGQCVYTTIQDAIDDAPPNSEIRVTKDAGTYFENLIIDKNLTLKGGYSSCGLAQLDSRDANNKSIIDGGNNSTVLTIGNDNLSMNISGFTFQNGQNFGFNPGGGLTLSGSSNEFNLQDVMIINNQGFFGGGIFLNGNSVLNLKSTRVQLNTAESGGGIYCSGSGQLHILNDSGVINNTAIDGGGVFASDCDVKLAAGGAHNNAGALKGISINFAENSGGGVYLDNSVLSIVQDAINGHIGPSNIDNNRANVDGDDMGDGGGIFAQDSIIYASFGYFYQNRVINGHGGAILLDNSNLISQDSSWCLYSSDKCTWFEGNFIEHNGPGEFHGGAIFAFNNSLIGSEPYPLKGYFVDNSADQGSGIALSFQSVAEIQGSYFVENGEYGFAEGDDLSVIHVDSANSEANIRFSTFANNNNMAVFNSHNSGKINLRNSIVYESNDSSLVYLNSGGLFEYLCNVFHDSNGFGFIWEGSESVFTTDPGFVDPENGDYHIKFDSVAVDKCNVENLQQTIRLDRDGDSRLIDLPDVSNGTGPQDAGADEYNDVIFRNGFEPGASSAG